MKQRRKKFRKKRLIQLIRSQTVNGATLDSGDNENDPELDKAPPPPAPLEPPPAHLRQPRLKKITAEMFAAFPVNPEPLYYYIQKIQQANGYHQAVPPPRMHDRFHYYKKQPPPSVGQSPGYLQQQHQPPPQRSAAKPQTSGEEITRNANERINNIFSSLSV